MKKVKWYLIPILCCMTFCTLPTAPNNGANSNITIYPGVYYEANVKIVSAPNDDTAHYYDILHDTVLNIQNGKMVYIYWVKTVPEWNGNPDTFELDRIDSFKVNGPRYFNYTSYLN